MKKTYIIPTIGVYELKASHHLLAGSELGIGEAGSADNAEGRENLFWEDEE